MLPVPRKGAGSRPRQTHGRQRSFLAQNEVSPQSMNQQPPEELQQPHSLSPLKRATPDASALPAMKRSTSRGGSPSLQISLSKASYSDEKTTLRTSHELREAGQSHRFKDEIEYILDGVRSKDRLKIRRTSCLDLTRSMLKEQFALQVRTHHYMPTIFEVIKYDQDPIVFSCLVLMIGIVLRDVQSCMGVVAIDNLVAYLCGSLEMDMDPMAMMPTARQDIAIYNDFKDLVRQSGIIQRGQKIMTKSIVLSVMACIVNECVSLQDVHTLSVVDQDLNFLIAVIEILIEDLAWIKQPSSTLGVSLPDVLDIDRIENCLRILERLALVSKQPAATLSNNTRIFPLLVQLITLCRAHALQYPQHTDSMNLMLRALQLLINITNGFEPCCENLAQTGLIQVLIQNFVQFYGHSRNFTPDQPDMELQRSETRSDSGLMLRLSSQGAAGVDGEEKDLDLNDVAQRAVETNFSSREIEIENDANGWYDILLLSIGLLLNMLENNLSRREHVTSIAIGLDCKAIGDCFHKECVCEKSLDALERLIEIFNTEATISEMTENQVLAAYLALLIGCIVGGNFENETRLYRSINGQTLAPMLELLHEFADIHEAAQAEKRELGDYDDELMWSQSSQQHQVPNESPLGASSLRIAASSLINGANVGLRVCSAQAFSGISFPGSKTAETQECFLKIIDVLQDVEKRHSRLQY